MITNIFKLSEEYIYYTVNRLHVSVNIMGVS